MKLLAFILLLFPLLAKADLLEGMDFSYQAFIQQGFVYSKNNNLYGESTKLSTEKREAGVLFSLSPMRFMDVRGFLKYEEMGDRYKEHPLNVKHLLVDIHNSYDVGQVGIRAGIVRNELGFYNISRENPISRDQDMAPQGVYRDTLKEFVNGGEGYQVYFNTEALPLINLEAEVSQVRPRYYPRQDVLSAWFPVIPKGDFEENSNARGLHLAASSKDLRLQVRYDVFDVKTLYRAGKMTSYPQGTSQLRFLFGG